MVEISGAFGNGKDDGQPLLADVTNVRLGPITGSTRAPSSLSLTSPLNVTLDDLADQYLQTIDQYLEGIDQHLEGIDQHLEKIDQHLEKINQNGEPFAYKRPQGQSRTEFIRDMLAVAKNEGIARHKRVAAMQASGNTALGDKKAINGSRNTQKQFKLLTDFLANYMDDDIGPFKVLDVTKILEAADTLHKAQKRRGVTVPAQAKEVLDKANLQAGLCRQALETSRRLMR